MSEELLVRYCSPTLAGMKTGSMYTCSFVAVSSMIDELRRLNSLLAGKGLRILPLRFRNNRALIYVYRPFRLSQDLQNNTACQLLEERGYDSGNPGKCIIRLRQRLSSKEFPHEIGLFLGYPPEDVCGFIENRATGWKCTGCWKVYGDADAARKLFAKYKKCTDIYCSLFAKGKSIEWLTVPLDQ